MFCGNWYPCPGICCLALQLLQQLQLLQLLKLLELLKLLRVYAITGNPRVVEWRELLATKGLAERLIVLIWIVHFWAPRFERFLRRP